ncbi:hypothetical protein ACFVWL_09580 [Microbacterium sp. NPDC058269]|uniref:hypothetical protein n=1 Tax=Microbacterium sp. NPDC058269 TaxID=3346414 RepID=UPI0036DA3C3A
MVHRRERANAAPLFAAAATAYAVNCALGASVAARLIDTSRFRWLHHALYIATCATSAVAVATGWSRGPRTAGRRAAVVLLPAAAPLAAIPYLGTHSRRHPLVALAAAPFIVAGLVLSRSTADRK